jgi:hypothetical protein
MWEAAPESAYHSTLDGGGVSVTVLIEGGRQASLILGGSLRLVLGCNPRRPGGASAIAVRTMAEEHSRTMAPPS